MLVTRSNPVLAVHDLDRSSAWYRDVLGCSVEDTVPGEWRFCRPRFLSKLNPSGKITTSRGRTDFHDDLRKPPSENELL